jgi:hypothetical protein
MRRSLVLAPLVAAMLLAGCADWHWYRMDEAESAPAPRPKPASRKAAPAPAPPATPPGRQPTAIPASAPPPRPRPAQASRRPLDDQIVGRWRRPGDPSCAAGPEVANDGRGRLVITTAGQKSVHKLEGVNSRRVLTRVVEPAGGPRYRLRVVKGGGDAERPFTLDVQNRATGGTVNWTPCSLS